MVTASQGGQEAKGLSKVNFQKTLYYFLPKNYKLESKKLLNEISKKYAKKPQQDKNKNKNLN